MPLTVTWEDAGLRIALTVLAAAAIGLDRRVEGHPAGIKTNILVALAACLAMLQANWLMNSVGKTPDSFVVLDLMRLPLGILTGVGFIGGGAILKRGEGVLGLTTAATLWFITVIGLCFGGGQFGLGIAGALLGILTLRVLKIFEERLKQERRAELRLKWKSDQFDAASALLALGLADAQISDFVVKHAVPEGVQELCCSMRRQILPGEHGLPRELMELARRPGVLEWEWKD
jgi:putative Mg2+ transporter-C (MgtC) family protein